MLIQDPVYAHELFLKSGQLGYAPSQYQLGLAYEYGYLNLLRDPRRSIAWYSKAAAQGDPESELALSAWYITGCDPILARSNLEAYLWAKKAADKGLAKAEFVLGYLKEYGIGATPDEDDGRRLYMRAAGQGCKQAVARLKDQNSGIFKPLAAPNDWMRLRECLFCE